MLHLVGALDKSSLTFYFGVKFYAADPCKLFEEITRSVEKCVFDVSVNKNVFVSKYTCHRRNVLRSGNIPRGDIPDPIVRWVKSYIHFVLILCCTTNGLFFAIIAARRSGSF